MHKLNKKTMHMLYRGCEKRFDYPQNICRCADCHLMRVNICSDALHMQSSAEYRNVSDDSSMSEKFIARYITYNDGAPIENEQYIIGKLNRIRIINKLYNSTRYISKGIVVAYSPVIADALNEYIGLNMDLDSSWRYSIYKTIDGEYLGADEIIKVIDGYCASDEVKYEQ